MEKHNVEIKTDTNNKIFPEKSNFLESQMKINTSEDEESNHVEAFEIPVISKKPREQTNTNNKIFPEKSNFLESQMKINTSEDEDSDHVEPFEIPVIYKQAREQTNINSKIFSDDVNNMCLIKCNICQMTFSSHKKRIHFRTYHTDFKHSYTYARKTYYR